MVDAAKVMNWEPIVSIGLRVWRPTSTYRRASLGLHWAQGDKVRIVVGDAAVEAAVEASDILSLSLRA